MKRKNGKKRESFFFYLKEDTNSEYGPYAFTTNSSIAYLFKSTRNDDFILFNKKYSNKEEYNLDCNKYQLKNIVMFEGITVKECTIMKFDFPLTVLETTMLNATISGILNVGLISNAWSDISILNYKYKSLLNSILYNEAYDYISGNSDYMNHLFTDDFIAIMKTLGVYLKI